MGRAVWVVEYYTESGDRGILGCWAKKPTKKQINYVAELEHPEDSDAKTIYFQNPEYLNVIEE